MVRHSVLFRLRPETEAQIEDLMASLQALQGRISEIREFQVARDEIGSERSASFGLISLFADYEALRRYQQHPDHQAFLSRIVPACEWIRAWDYSFEH